MDNKLRIFAVGIGVAMVLSLSILSSPSANAGFFDDLQKQVGEWQKEAEKQVGEYQKEAEEWWEEEGKEQVGEWQKEAEKQVGEYQKEVEEWWEEEGKEQVGEWQKEAEKQVGEYQKEVEEWWEEEGKEQFEETWRDIKKEVPKLQKKTEISQEEIVKMNKQAEEIWKEMPEEDREIIMKAVRDKTQTTIPILYHDPENGKSGVTFVTISPVEGKIKVYEPSDREIRTLLTDTAVSTVTGGKVRVDDVEDLEIEKTGENTYKTKIKAKARILSVIPVEVDYEAEVNIETGEIKNVEKPWWNVLIIG